HFFVAEAEKMGRRPKKTHFDTPYDTQKYPPIGSNLYFSTTDSSQKCSPIGPILHFNSTSLYYFNQSAEKKNDTTVGSRQSCHNFS
ncbi:MAG: hypothetical protein K2G78_02885, partial [Muribaculaceae bacterium]|nr:hypothetical protein [Muribaculaceae bacterium]